MATVNDILNHITQIAFIALGIVTLGNYLRRGGRVRRDTALMFASLAITVGIGVVSELLNISLPLLWLIALMALTAQPYLLIRLVRYFGPIPSSIKLGAVAGLLGSWFILIFIPDPIPTPLVLAVILYFVLIDGYAMAAFVQGALRTSGVVQRRLRFGAAGSGLLALALFWLGVSVVLPSQQLVGTSFLQLSSIGAAFSFYLGLASPQWLRQTWQFSELHEFLLQVTRSSPPATTAAVYNTLCYGTLKVTGGSQANILVKQDDPARWMLHNPSVVGDPAPVEMVSDLEQYWQQRSPAAIAVKTLNPGLREELRIGNAELLYVVPMVREDRVWGLVLVLLEHGSLFVDDDLQIISLFAEESAIVLENIELVEYFRNYADQLEQRVLQRTEELRASEAKYRALIEFAPDPIVIANGNGTITLINQRAEEAFGYSQSELVGKPVEMLLPISLHDIHAKHRARYMNKPVKRAMGATLDLRVRRKNGTELPVRIGLSPIVIGDETLVMTYILDITSDKQLEAGLRAALAQEKELNALKTSFTSIVSHEFRTPLSVILSSTGILSRYAERLDDDQRDEKLGNIDRQVKRLMALLDDVLTITHSESVGFGFKPSTHDLVALCNEIIDEARITYDHPVQIAFTHEGACDEVQVDEFLYRHIMQNLTSNAIKYSPDGGTVRIHVDCGDQVMTLRVEDDGIGIPEAHQKRMFEAFNRATNVGDIQGSGIGLTIVKRAVDAYGGSVEFESTEGKGTTFIVRLPYGGASSAA
ncbi:MAG: PAS domain S-box protein [Anaerolineae bacterium]|nr:PAS domain S-box protein [Anaerolineae bacterium]